MSQTFTEFITLEKLSCGDCGGTFALNAEFLKVKREEKGGWTCPYCKKERGYWTSRADILERDLRAAKCEVLAAKNAEEAAKIETAKLIKKLGRVNKGVCPCCNRHFVNLERHMKTKHPEQKHQHDQK